jgi:acrylyl-CoA reductase (NADPH)
VDRFPAVVVTGPGPASIVQLGEDELSDAPVTVDVEFSSLNYKDGLAVTGRGRVVRSFPMTCGIDLAGRVVASQDPTWRAGDEVLVTGCGLSETHPGGYTTRQRLHGEWLVRMPAGLDARRAMALGTAGFTAMLGAMAIEFGVPGAAGAEVLVTGAGGGVGSLAVAILSRLGYAVTASTGRPQLHGYLSALGAAGFLERAELAEASDRPLQSERWAGVVDTVGGTTLANAIAQTRRDGVIAACGLVGGSDLPTTVFPFILRGVQLIGIESVWRPNDLRAAAWGRLAATLPAQAIDALSEVRPMSDIASLAEDVLAGRVRGRIVVDPSS